LTSRSRAWRRIGVTATLIVALGCGRRAVERAIGREDVEHVLSVLAADSMEGRAAFTPAAAKAAAFIRGQFAQIGLEHLDGLTDYLQRFPVYATSVTSRSATLNGRPVPDAAIVSFVTDSAIHWRTGDGTQIVIVGASDDPMSAVSAARRSSGSTIVLLNRHHRQVFDQAARYLGGPTRGLDHGGGANALLILSDEPRVTSYRVDVTANVATVEGMNVVGTIPGERSDEIVIFSAHYDHIGIQPPVNGDSIANGANDDASGTTAVIELARYFRAAGTPTRTLIFVTFTAEEVGGFGSRYFSRQLDPDRIVAMFNIEMIGKPATEGPNTAWITGFDRSTFGSILQEAVRDTPYRFYPDPYPDQNLFFRSDNATLARLGVPAHSISTTPIDVDRDYHQVSDEMETLDIDHLRNTIQAIATGATTIVSGDATPTRVVVGQAENEG
jgi:Peptidase family M28